MKKITTLILTFLILLSSFGCVNAVQDVSVYVNGKYLSMDQPAIIANGRTLVPLRAICEALKCEVTWNGETQTAQIQNEVTIISTQVNNYKMIKVERKDERKEEIINLDVPPIIHNDRTLVPARAISDALHAEVEWDGENKRVDITLEFDYIGWFNKHGIAEVRKEDKYGYINKNREVVIPIIYDHVFAFKEGFSVVGKEGKWGLIDINGSEVVPIKYELADNFSDGLSRVSIDEKWGYVDTNGNLVIPMIYDNAQRFKEGLAKVEKDGETFYIDKTGKKIK